MGRKRIAVAGGAGFVGSHICDRLLEDGYEVLCIDNLTTGCLRNVAHLLNEPRFNLLNQDLNTLCDLPGSLDAILHLASPASPSAYLRLPIYTLKCGSIGTFNALELARRKGARFLFASTSEIYGDPRVHPQPEDYWGHVNPIGPRAVYDEAKRFSEATSVAYRSHLGVDTAIVRIFNTFGPRMSLHDGRAVPTFIRQALFADQITVAGDGSQTRSLCFIDDTVEAIARLLYSAHPGPLNIGNPEELTVLELAERVKAITSSSAKIVFVPRPQDDPDFRKPDISLAKKLLDWRPTVSVENGLRRTIDWHLANS